MKKQIYMINDNHIKIPPSQVAIYGYHPCIAALSNQHRHIHMIYATEQIISSLNDSTTLLSNKKSIIHITNIQNLSKMLPNITHQGFLIIADKIKKYTLRDIEQSLQYATHTSVVILDQVTDPRNIGSIMRCAVAFGIKFIIFPKDNSPNETSTMIKTACGAIEQISWIEVTNLNRTILHLQKIGFWIVGLSSHGKSNINAINGFNKLALILGSEEKGIRPSVLKHCDIIAKIPMTQNVESLNIANAAAILFHKIYTQSIP